MAFLYVNPKGYEVRSFSYSQGVTFHECAQKYKLQRLDGWNEIGTSAARLFGLALEAAIKTYHETDLDLEAGIVHFVNEWTDIKELHTFERWAEKNDFSPRAKSTLKRLGIRGFRAGDPIKYTPGEGNWENLLQVGQEMLKLYHLRLPLSPIDLSAQPQFQIKHYKELFPGTELSGIEFVAYIDMMARDKNSLGDARFWDIKTSGASLDLTPGILALDQQIRSYAWITGCADGGMIYFQKQGRGLERGIEVSLLADAGDFKAGQSAVVIKYQEAVEAVPARPADPAKPRSKPKEAVPAVPEETWIVENESIIEQMFQHCGKGQTKEEKDARNIFIRENATLIAKENVTRQKLHFVTAHISLSDQAEAARQIGQDVAAITHANAENWWPKTGGVRFPNNRCCTCQMRGICLDSPELRDKLVHRADDAWDIETDND